MRDRVCVFDFVRALVRTCVRACVLRGGDEMQRCEWPYQ